MKTCKEEEFLRWASSHGLALDPKYPRSAVLTYNSVSDARFWTVPERPELRPYFLGSLIDLFGDWRTCYVWRHLGSWPDPARIDARRINDAVELQILKGLGLPLGSAAVVQFDRSERDLLITLLFSTTVFGWSVGEDLYIVPDHAQQFIQTDHHDAVHVSFRVADEVKRWVDGMAEEGFHLPDELPDETFKRPTWMDSDEPKSD